MPLRLLPLLLTLATAAFCQVLPKSDTTPPERNERPSRGNTGMHPRDSAGDYPAHEALNGIEVAASIVPPDQVKKLFVADLNKGGYVVLEVAVYPESGKTAEISAKDFLLRIGSDGTMVRPAGAAAIGAQLGRKDSVEPPKRESPVHVMTGGTIGAETGSINGQRRSGVYTGTSAGVGIGDPGPSMPYPQTSNKPDRYDVQMELEDKALPEGRTAIAVAGYLYFPKPAAAKQKNATWNLTWYAADGQIRLAIPPPAK